ncbi:MAG: hypothetical protein H6505_02975 [Calditrichaeota bacterium]|nr:hypothetical protein [Calditrichota bacterium]
MNARFILAGVLAGLAMFVWGAVSHMMIPWHDATYNTFRDEDLVAEVLMKEAGESGIYIAPMAGMLDKGLTDEQRDQRMNEAWDKGKQGPNIFMSFHREGKDGMAMPMILDLVTLIVMSLLMLFLLQAVPQLTWMGKVLFVVIAGTAGIALVQMEQWIWWSFSSGYVLVNIVDGAIRWAVGGMVLAKVGK